MERKKAGKILFPKMEDLEDVFPSLREARASVQQGAFEHGIEIYCEILENVNPDDEKVPYLYLEYADALIKSSNSFFIEEISKISNRQGLDLRERKETEEDLEIAWDLLEICRNAFTILKDYGSLATSQFLLGEISLLNNRFHDALHELTECVSTMDKVYEKDDVKYVDVYLSMANCYEFMEDFSMSREYYNKAIGVYRAEQGRKSSEEVVEAIGDIITELVQKSSELEYKKKRSEDVGLPSSPEDDDAVIDINACRRNKR